MVKLKRQSKNSKRNPTAVGLVCQLTPTPSERKPLWQNIQVNNSFPSELAHVGQGIGRLSGKYMAIKMLNTCSRYLIFHIPSKSYQRVQHFP